MTCPRRDWRAYILERAAWLKGPGWAPSAERGIHMGGANLSVPWPEGHPSWLLFDYVMNGYVTVWIEGFTPVPVLVDDERELARVVAECERREGEA